MAKKLSVTVGITLICLAAVFLFFYFFLGLRFVFDAYSTIERLPQQNKINAYDTLSPKGWGTSQVKGLLGRLDGDINLNGIWIWNMTGLKYYKASQNVRFSTFSICDNGKWQQSSTTINKSDTINYGVWHKKTRQGDFLEIVLAKNGDVEQVTDYDWWVFSSPLPASYFELTCKNR